MSTLQRKTEQNPRVITHLIWGQLIPKAKPIDLYECKLTPPINQEMSNPFYNLQGWNVHDVYYALAKGWCFRKIENGDRKVMGVGRQALRRTAKERRPPDHCYQLPKPKHEM